MSVRTWDRGLGFGFAALGVALALAGWGQPEGLAGVPGPGFFPILIGVGLTALGLGLAASAGRGDASYWQQGWRTTGIRQVVVILALLVIYVALWDAVPFLWRTPFLMLGIYRTVGEPWVRSIIVSVVATALLTGVFETLLRVRL
jgi:putative tricarboxylic transport membrane protein